MSAVPTFLSYDVMNWYYQLSGNATQVWSSDRLQYVPVADAAYQAWLNLGFSPTIINGVSPAADQAWLNNITQTQVLPGLLDAGVDFTATSSQSWTAATFAIGPRNVLLAKYAQCLGLGHLPTAGTINEPIVAPSPSAFSMPDINGVMYPFSYQQFAAFYSGVTDYIGNLSQAIATVIGGGPVISPSVPFAVDGYSPTTITGGAVALGTGATFVPCAPSAPITLTAPPNPTDKQSLIIADVGGTASAVNFIQFTGNIDGTTNRKIAFPWGFFQLQYVLAQNLWKQV